MKKIVFLIIFNLSLLSVNISAQTVTASGTTGPLIWSLNSAGTLTISGNGAMPDYSPGGLPWYNYQSNIKTVILSNGVTSIGNYAFYSCSNLTSITIPNSVRSIGSYAFYYCPNLTSISIPSGVTSIGSYAFFYCSNLTSITIPSSVTNIGSYGVFYYCSNLTSINVASDNVNYSSENGVLFNKNKTILIAFPRGKNGIYTIPNSVTSIGSDAFGYCSNLTSITIPSSVTNISSYAFQYCFNLKTITVNWSVPFTVNSFVFSGLNTYSITLYVPSGTKSAYQTNSVWGNFNIVESAAASYMITASAGSGGTISPSGSVSFTYGSSRTFYFYSNTGYEINQVLVDGVNNASAVANGYYTFSNVTANHTISVSFRQRQYTITASAGSGGSISPSGSVSFTYGSSRTFYFYPNTGYEINQVLVDGVNNVSAVSYGYYTFSNVTANHTISVSFKQKQYTITASAGSGGTISPSGSVSFTYGSSRTFYFYPNTGYEINQVLVDGVNNVSAVSYGYYTFSNVTANHTISVSFKQSCIPNLVVQVWDDVLSVINQPANNGGYTFVSYQWQRNGVDIPGETFGNLYLPVVDNAQYVVLLTTNNGQKLRSCPVYLHPVTSKAISAYPNPTKGALTIESDEIQAGDIIEIYTVTGTLVRQYPAEAKQTILNVASLSKGIYFVKVNNERIKLLKINK